MVSYKKFSANKGVSLLARRLRKPYQNKKVVTTIQRAIPMRPGGFLQADIRQRGTQPELFSNDIATATYVADTTGAIVLLNGVAQGDDINNRHGRRIQNKSVHIQGFLAAVDATTVDSLCRLMVVYDKQPNGVALTIADVLTAVTASAFNKLDNRDRFVVLADKKIPLGGTDNTATQAVGHSPGTIAVNIHRRINLPTTHIGTGATIASIGTGSIYMLTVGTAAPNAGGKFTLDCRTRYTDV